MKHKFKSTGIALLLAAFTAGSGYAQTGQLFIYGIDGAKQEIPVGNVEKLTFTGSSSLATTEMKIHKVGVETPKSFPVTSLRLFSSTDYLFPFTIAHDNSVTYNASTSGDIVFSSSESYTAQLLDIPAGGLQVTGKVYVKRTFMPKTWYPMGFPFAISKIEGDFPSDPELYIHQAGVQDGDFWLKAYNGNTFDYAGAIDQNTGYILQFPDAFSGVEVTFTSEDNPVLKNLTESDLNLSSGTYTLLANPSVKDLEIGNTSGNYYYTYNQGSNNFALLASGSTANVKPFEAFIAVTGISPSALKSALNIDAITGIGFSTDDPVIKTQYYTLEGKEIAQPQSQGIYIVKKLRASRNTETSKIIYRKGK
ncbi:MAG: hypothetical protein LBG77_08720 [Dysgonamonadaceae bacterium]|jgi:hypothetical protein|nr:hypothetical protein [Dysgonamonadaceae bacterium]